MLSHAGAAMNARDAAGLTPLDVARERRQRACVEVLNERVDLARCPVEGGGIDAASRGAPATFRVTLRASDGVASGGGDGGLPPLPHPADGSQRQ